MTLHILELTVPEMKLFSNEKEFLSLSIGRTWPSFILFTKNGKPKQIVLKRDSTQEYTETTIKIGFLIAIIFFVFGDIISQ